MTPIRTVLVVGSGAMGSQIAMVCANAGLTVACTDLDQSALDRAESMLRTRMESNVAKGRMTAAQRDAAFDRLTLTTDRDTAARTADLVIEAAVEKLDVKRSLFAELAALAPDTAILASNSSSFVPSSMASAVPLPERFCNIHFFNPALVMKCVEVVRGPETSDETMAAATAFVEKIGKTPVVLEKEIPGFVANRILGAVRDEALRLLEGGYADVVAIDTACRTALGYPMGPFELMDLTGIDIGYLVKKQRFAESGDPADEPAETVARLVERGDLGRKTGSGWYTYSESGEKQGLNPL
ncbi:3-hydroxyacyl-CoA dehydrogenase family protein [Rhodococcus sp. IEGM 1408]|uniref:3-hydroxyacyl-CoA dehydrogenase family protein n=1 Tax=Rhodococcus sp. IEGM 1408 TaxID=3082220 RepID=UPI00295366AC|nr:3-hydroxyacyl-CoA dehydrogenase family protein [Rhodococcus sp. IEGM 1408]MDV8002528.1 3-hydroxyacyl-CoA dehydrogenase family protein [Rhodococcus sp. IEGM 1408]